MALPEDLLGERHAPLAAFGSREAKVLAGGEIAEMCSHEIQEAGLVFRVAKVRRGFRCCSRGIAWLQAQNRGHDFPLVSNAAKDCDIFGPSIDLEARTRFFRKMPSMVVVRCQFQVHASDFHFLVRVLDTQIRQADFAIDHRKVQLLREGVLEVEGLVSILCLSVPQLSIELFLQLVIELNADDLATLVFDPVGHLVVQAIKIGIVTCFLRLSQVPSKWPGVPVRNDSVEPGVPLAW